MGNGELSLTDERTRLTKYQADLAQIELKKARGELLNTEEAMKYWSEVVMACRQRLLGFPTRLAPTIATTQSIPEIKERIEHAIHEVLNEFTNPDLSRIARNSGHPSGLEALPAPAKINRKRVGRRKKEAELRKQRGAGNVAH